MSDSNVNVTLTGQELPTFPCPLCGAMLDVRTSRANKPYCVCNSVQCGLQIFFRGKQAIARLRQSVNTGERIGGHSARALVMFERLESLRAQKDTLERKRAFLFTDEDLEHAIRAIEIDIARVQIELGHLVGDSKS